jgi:phosphatidylethanolamine/phosphatidyl-N-methylethanolamine N-methyltransferase
MEELLRDTSCAACERTYRRIAPVYDLLDAVYERSWKGRLRAELFRHAGGRVLDVGVGSGRNLPYYPAGSEAVGIDLSRPMLKRAARRARAIGSDVRLAQMNLLELAFPDGAFDTVVATFVLLCLPDGLQLAALRELRRVCRPDGRILLLDYRLPSHFVPRTVMRCLSPWLRWAFHGRYDVSTDLCLDRAGLRPTARRPYAWGSVTLCLLTPSSSSAEQRHEPEGARTKLSQSPA